MNLTPADVKRFSQICDAEGIQVDDPEASAAAIMELIKTVLSGTD
jgi:hypothetical protein